MKLPGIVRLERHATIASTQDEAKRLAEAGSPEGTLVWADVQTAGRGRMSRRWKSAQGGLYLSLILRPSFTPGRLAALSLWAADAAARAIRERTGLVCVVKPPNDVLAYKRQGAGEEQPTPQKVCGILIEARGGAARLDWAVAGVGINANNHIPPSLPHAASLRQLAGVRVDTERLLRGLLKSFWDAYATLV